MTNKELVAAGHAFAKAQGADAPLTEIAKLVSDLATRLDVITVLSDVLAAENLALKNYIDGECYIESKRTGVYTCAGINKPETPATDEILNEVRAEAVESLWRNSLRDVGRALSEIGAYHDASEAGGIVHDEIKERVDDRIAQLRAGKDGE